ncbi:hypothetical protein [Bacillus cereus]|uniref:hypothetical protein n=1 Tax=Bacillus cereus TaxID=1396 RepID=UPI000BF9FDE5|nr:hypothetical protein [Bacillus cereus]PFO61351.1 hypothetical protein COJ83_28915 [Bacillus cereus]PGX01041.1 hypothetical protein COE32_00755 [Bacillus cereus]PGY37895.1 hypothetical protein COE06_23515 [Bacillus cereus]
MKKVLIGIGTLGILSGLYAFSNYEINGENQKSNNILAETKQSDNKTKNTNTTMEVNSHADFKKTYDSVQDLVNSSDIIIEGKIIETNYFDKDQSTFTKSKVQVTKSFNNKAKTGDIIHVLERGGITTKGKIHEYNPEKFEISENEKNTPVQISFDGAPITKKNESVLIFGVQQKPGFFGFNETIYYPLNSHQGKFNIDNNTVKRYSDDENSSVEKKQKTTNFQKTNNDNSSNSLKTSLENMEKQIQDNLQNK